MSSGVKQSTVFAPPHGMGRTLSCTRRRYAALMDHSTLCCRVFRRLGWFLASHRHTTTPTPTPSTARLRAAQRPFLLQRDVHDRHKRHLSVGFKQLVHPPLKASPAKGGGAVRMGGQGGGCGGERRGWNRKKRSESRTLAFAAAVAAAPDTSGEGERKGPAGRGSGGGKKGYFRRLFSGG